MRQAGEGSEIPHRGRRIPRARGPGLEFLIGKIRGDGEEEGEGEKRVGSWIHRTDYFTSQKYLDIH